MNRVCLTGRLTAKPELRYTPTNTAVTKFSVAVNRKFKNQNGETEADFINCIAWRKTAEVICNYFDKGSQIGIEGRIQTGSYDDKDGSKRYTTDVVVEEVTFIDSKKEPKAEEKHINEDPFESFGEQVSIDDNFLE